MFTILMSSSKQNLENALKEQIVCLVTHIRNKFPDNEDIVTLEFFFKRYPADELMNNVIMHVLPLADKIKRRQDSFFLNNHNFFQKITKDKVDFFSKMWNGSKLSPSDKESIWEYFELFVEFANEYKKKQ